MILQKIKNNNGFVLLFAVTLAAILLSVALGVANIAFKEVRFGTSARDSNDAFFAADTGIENVLQQDKPPSVLFLPTAGNTQTANFTFTGLGSANLSCAIVSITKDNTQPPKLLTTIVSDGYNIGDAACASTNPNRVQRELKVSYGGGTGIAQQADKNLALPANGGSVSASSTASAGFPASSTTNGERAGAGWSLGTGGWNDGDTGVYPDWLEVDFSGPSSRNLSELDVYTLADNFPITPTPTNPATLYGITDFQVQYDNGSGWQTVPGGSVTGNTLAWRQFIFSTIPNVTKVRVYVTQGRNSYSRIVELEAYGN